MAEPAQPMPQEAMPPEPVLPEPPEPVPQEPVPQAPAPQEPAPRSMAYLGPPGTFSEQAAVALAGAPRATLVPAPSITAAGSDSVTL